MNREPPERRGAAANDAPTVKISAMPKVLGRISRLAFRYPWRLGAAALTSLGAAVVSLAIPRGLRVAVDAGQGHGAGILACRRSALGAGGQRRPGDRRDSRPGVSHHGGRIPG